MSEKITLAEAASGTTAIFGEEHSQNRISDENDPAIIDEENYLTIMKTEIAPWLDTLRQSVLLDREGTQKLYCEYYLQPEDTSKGSIFISHGFTESCGKYHEVIYYFLKAGYSVCLIEHRGHGRSRRVGESDIASSPTDIEKFQYYIYDMDYVVNEILKKKLPAPYYLFAHSMGGAIGATYLEKHPGTFDKAIFTAPMFEINSGGMPKLLVKAVIAIACAFGKQQQFLSGQQPFSPEENFADSAATSEPRYRYYFEQQLATPEFQSGGSSFRWARESIKATERLLDPANCSKVDIPVLLFQAGADTIVSPGGQDKFIERIPDGRLILVPDVKHEIYLSPNETLEKYWDVIFSFLS